MSGFDREKARQVLRRVTTGDRATQDVLLNALARCVTDDPPFEGSYKAQQLQAAYETGKQDGAAQTIDVFALRVLLNTVRPVGQDSNWALNVADAVLALLRPDPRPSYQDLCDLVERKAAEKAELESRIAKIEAVIEEWARLGFTAAPGEIRAILRGEV